MVSQKLFLNYLPQGSTAVRSSRWNSMVFFLWYTLTQTHTHGSHSITLTADVGGNNKNLLRGITMILEVESKKGTE